ncbi:hypothetical protein ACFL5F_07245 [Planctomycetota bacterium]
MTNKKDKKWLDEKMAQATDFGKVRFDAQGWKQKYIRESSFSYKDIKPHKNIWRFIMESKITKYSAAAVVALAMTLVLLSPFGTPGNGNVVLAEVQQKVAEIDTMILRGQKTLLRPGKDGDLFEFDGIEAEFDVVKYHSKQYGYVEEGYAGDSLFYRATFNLPKRQTLLVFPTYKKYVTFPSTDKHAQLLETLLPNGIVDLLVGSDYKELGRDNIDGVEAQCFEFQTIESLKDLLPKPVLHMQDFKGKIWIGIEEQLPVRLEAELSIGKSLMTMFNDLILHEVNVLDKYNITIDEDVFDIEPPEGYTEITFSDILPFIPMEAKAGLAGLGIIPVGLIVWKRRKKTAARKH